QRCGTSMPWRFAASIRLSSDRPATLLPFSVNSTGLVTGCAAVLRSMTVSTATGPPSLDLLRKILDDGERRIRCRLPESADRRVNHGLRQLLQQRLIPAGPLHERERLVCAGAAGRALATGLLGKELHEIARRIRRSVLNREDHDRRRPDEAAVLAQRVEIERNVSHRCRQA